MSNLKENKISSEIIYQGRLLDVRRDEVRLPNGNISTREWIKHPGAVCMIPQLPDNRIALIRQYRYPVQQEMIELPAGKMEENENPEACAMRELEEEIGFRAEKLTFLTHIYPAIGFADELMWLYMAENLVKTISNQDEDEFLEIMPTPLKKALKMVWHGEITDAKTIIGILWAERLLS